MSKITFHEGEDYAVLLLPHQTTDAPLARLFGDERTVKKYGKLFANARTGITAKEKAVIRAVVAILHSPRNRFGKIESRPRDQLEDAAQAAGCLNIPHGGLDAADKAGMILQCLIGDKPTSMLDADR